MFQFKSLGQRERRVLFLDKRWPPFFNWRPAKGRQKNVVKRAFSISDVSQVLAGAVPGVVGLQGTALSFLTSSPRLNENTCLSVITSSKTIVMELASREERDRMVRSLNAMRAQGSERRTREVASSQESWGGGF